mgnify:CR=1 FL=1|tara:strand:+ start:244 stop:4227 length:3984 start_codon:yes stop_codon:yes gene_type:complete
MAEGRRNWLKQITRWIFSAPNKKDNINKNVSRKNVEDKVKKENNKNVHQPSLDNQTKIKSKDLLGEAWKRFINQWINQGYKVEQFIEDKDLEKTIESLDNDFRDELIDSLFKISSNTKALKSLADILERGKVSVGDNIIAIRSFSYISALTIERTDSIPKVEDNDVLDVKKEIPDVNTNIKEKEVVDVIKENTKTSDKVDIKFLNLSIRTYNTLRRAELNYISDIEALTKDQLLSVRNLGNKSVKELLNAIEVYKTNNVVNKIISINKESTEKIKSVEKYKEVDPKFQNKILELKEFILDNDRLPKSYEGSIGSWCSIQRSLKRKGELSEDKIYILETIDYWVWDAKKANLDLMWSQSFDELQKFVLDKNRLPDEREIILFRWCVTQSQNQKQGKLSDKRIKLLESIPFWTLLDKNIKDSFSIEPVNSTFLNKVQDIKEFIKKNNRYPKNSIPSEISLYSWIRNQKNLKNEDNLSKMKITILESIPFWDWSIEVKSVAKDYSNQQAVNSTFLNKVKVIKEFIANNNRYPKSSIAGETTLQTWIRNQKLRKKQNQLNQNEIDLLETIKGWDWSVDLGKKYWTYDKLILLLNDIEKQLNLDKNVMPSNAQIFEFLEIQDINSYYHGQRPNSIIYSLTDKGTLNWSDVAKRFDRIFIPEKTYKEITLAYIRSFVKDLGEHIESLTPAEIYVLFQSQGISRKDNQKFSRTFDLLVDAIQSGVVSKDELGEWANNNDVPKIQSLLEFGSELKDESSIENQQERIMEERSKKIFDDDEPEKIYDSDNLSKDDLPQLDPAKTLNALDKATEIVENSSSDEDKVEFLKAKATAKLWDSCFDNESRLVEKIEELTTPLDGYSQKVKDDFILEYKGAKSLNIPETYKFVDLKGKKRDPKLMQRLVAFRLLRDKRLLNLSGTGTGKTLSAIFSAQVCGAKRILISSPNGAISTWVKAFKSAFPDAILHIKEDGWSIPHLDNNVHVYLVNHERFQEIYAERILDHCVNYQSDLIVIDEIHQSKKRTQEKSSQRRKLMNEYIRISSNMNPELRVLGMSATPVINNLYEGRSLLELVVQKRISDVEEKIDLNSCMNLYQHFVREGIRMNPGAMSRTKVIKKTVDATSKISDIIFATRYGTYHDVEQLLVEPKLNVLSECLDRKKKTIIFITYIKNTLVPISNWLERNNYTYCVYTGNDKAAEEEGFKDSLDQFIHGSTEVLIASIKCVGTGVDGLQETCNKAVFFQLPWTSTEFEQAVGRLDRDGTEFESIDVFLPLTDINLPNGEKWSWCRSKLDRINSKRDIAKAAVDGDVPDAASIISPSEASKYWCNWLERLNEQSY